MVSFPIDDIKPKGQPLSSNPSKASAQGQAAALCFLYRKFPDVFGPKTPSDFAGKIQDGILQNLCGEDPAGPLPPPRPQPFTGGQCCDSSYDVVSIVTNNANGVTTNTSFTAHGRVGNVETRSLGNGKQWFCKITDCSGGITETSILSIPNEDAEDYTVTIDSVTPRPGFTDDCGDPVREYPPTNSTPDDFNPTINIPLPNGDSFDLDLDLNPVFVDGTLNVKADGVNIQYGPNEVNINIGGNGSGDSASPPVTPGDLAPDIEDIKDRIGDLEDAIDGIRDKVDALPTESNCEECDLQPVLNSVNQVSSEVTEISTQVTDLSNSVSTVSTKVDSARNTILAELIPTQSPTIKVGRCAGDVQTGLVYEVATTHDLDQGTGINRILQTLNNLALQVQAVHQDVCSATETCKNLPIALPDIPIKGCVEQDGVITAGIKQSVVKQSGIWATGGSFVLELVLPALMELLFEQLGQIVEDDCNRQLPPAEPEECVPFALYPNPDVYTRFPKEGILQLHFVEESVVKRSRDDSIWYKDIPNPIDIITWDNLKDFRVTMGNQYAETQITGFENALKGYFRDVNEANSYFNFAIALTKETEVNRNYPFHTNAKVNIQERTLRIYRAIYVKLDPATGEPIEKICLKG